MEADLAQFYGIDLAEALAAGRWRRLWVLITQLPPGNRLGPAWKQVKTDIALERLAAKRRR